MLAKRLWLFMARKQREKRNRQHLPANRTEGVFIQQRSAQVSLGPIPSASSLEEYRTVREDLPNIIINTWQEDAKTRRDSIKTDASIKKGFALLEYIKVAVVAIFAFGMLGFAFYLALQGQYKYAVGVVVSPILVAIIDAFRHK